MVNIYTDNEKLNIICDFTNHQNFPYGTTTLTYKINGLMMDASNELILFNNSQNGFVFASFVNDLYFSGVKATMATVNDLFQETCFSCCGSGGGGGGSIHIDTDDIVDALEDINETLKNGSSGSGSCDCEMWEEEYLTLDEYNAKDHDATTKYLIYCEDDDCSYSEEDIDTGTTIYSSTTVTTSQCNENDLYAITTTTQYKSTDSGSTWVVNSITTSSALTEENCAACMSSDGSFSVTYEGVKVKSGITDLIIDYPLSYKDTNYITAYVNGTKVNLLNSSVSADLVFVKATNVFDGNPETVYSVQMVYNYGSLANAVPNFAEGGLTEQDEHYYASAMTISDGATELNPDYQRCIWNKYLYEITIPSSVTYVNFATFIGLRVTDIYCYATTAPSLTLNPEGDYYTNITLHVPSGADYSSWQSSDWNISIVDDL